MSAWHLIKVQAQVGQGSYWSCPLNYQHLQSDDTFKSGQVGHGPLVGWQLVGDLQEDAHCCVCT
jgi:hypothetical protein